jgi:hypothetical protein
MKTLIIKAKMPMKIPVVLITFSPKNVFRGANIKTSFTENQIFRRKKYSFYFK